MGCPCENAKRRMPKCDAGTPPVIEINGGECPVLFHTVNIPASVGTVETLPPTPGAYRNARVTYEADNVSYLYDSDGIPQLLSNGGGGGGAVESVNGKTGEVVLDANDVGAATPSDISGLQGQIDALTVASDVTDIVGTYADLQSYDTSKLKDNDIIKVLEDENQDDQTTYYRWDTETESFTLIGAEGPYYTKSAADTKFQDKLTAGTNIQISGSTISATDTTYLDFVGTDGVDAGTAGLVPAPATTDAGKFLKADGTWDTAGGTLYTTYGQNEDGAMTQKATTDLVYTGANPKKINIGDNGVTGGTNTIIIGSEDSGTIYNRSDQVVIGHDITDTGAESVAIGHSSTVGEEAVAIGHKASASGTNAIAIGKNSSSSSSSTISIGASASSSSFDAISIRGNASGVRAIAVGVDTSASANDSLAIGGRYTTATQSGAVAIGGQYAGAKYADSVALGSHSFPRAVGVVDVSYTYGGTGGGYNSSNYRVISGVYNGEKNHDAATVAQGNKLMTAAPTTTNSGVLGQLWTDTSAMHTYQLTAIDTTDPDNPVYTWTQRW